MAYGRGQGALLVDDNETLNYLLIDLVPGSTLPNWAARLRGPTHLAVYRAGSYKSDRKAWPEPVF